MTTKEFKELLVELRYTNYKESIKHIFFVSIPFVLTYPFVSGYFKLKQIIGKVLSKIATTSIGKNSWVRRACFDLKYKIEKDPWEYYKFKVDILGLIKDIKHLGKFNEILEIGSGDGSNIKSLKTLGKVTASDIIHKIKDGVNIIKLDIITDRINKKFDMIFAKDILYYVHPSLVEDTVKNIKSMLKQGGFLVRYEINKRPAFYGLNFKYGSKIEFDMWLENEFKKVKELIYDFGVVCYTASIYKKVKE